MQNNGFYDHGINVYSYVAPYRFTVRLRNLKKHE